MLSQQELFEREKHEWLDIFEKVKEITGKRFVELTFEESELPISFRHAMGRLSPILGSTAINVSPVLYEIKTSRNFKLVGLMHEFGEYHRTNSPIVLLHSTILRPWPKYKETYCNRFVFKKLTEQYGKEEATKRMYQFVEEWMIVQDSLYGSSSQLNLREICDYYIKKNMPFLLERVSI